MFLSGSHWGSLKPTHAFNFIVKFLQRCNDILANYSVIMSLLTPTNLKYILSTSIFSRILIILIQFASNIIIDDHDADAYRNKYFRTIAYNSSKLIIPDSYLYLYKSIEGFTRWDSQYFLEISTNGYVSEQHLAFLPLFPVSISFVRQFIFERKPVSLGSIFPNINLDFDDQFVLSNDIENYMRSTLVGLLLNNFVFFPLACLSLFALTKLVKSKDDKYAKEVVWWFCYNPASVFFSACYSESLFSALTFTAMFIIEYKSNDYLTRHQETRTDTTYQPLSQLNRLLFICLPCLAFIALSSATRSNGIITIGFLCYQFLLKYAPIYYQNRLRWSPLMYISLVLEFIQDILVLVISSVIAASGYITFQIYSYIKFCIKESNHVKGKLYIRPEWCNSLIPHHYGYIQAKYWNVGLFRYYHIKQLPNFLLALPISYLVMNESMRNSRDTSGSRINKKQLAYYLQGIFLTLLCGISINIQVTTRLLASSCPVVYWICVDARNASRMKHKLILLYFISYFVMGTVLHTNFYPWT